MSTTFNKAESQVRSPKLAAIPASVQLSAELENMDAPISRIVDLIEQEPIICEKVLRMANSPRYGVGRAIKSVGEAVCVVGFQTIRNDCLAAVPTS